jgi:hypothetical protein
MAAFLALSRATHGPAHAVRTVARALQLWQITVRSLPKWQTRYFHLMMRRGRMTAKVAMARRLAIRLYWMWREGRDYEQHRSSVRTQDGPEQAMVCSRTPSN